MRAILLILLYSMTIIKAALMDDFIRDARVKTEEDEDLSPDAMYGENLQRFIGDENYNIRRRRSGRMQHKLINNELATFHAKNIKNRQKMRRHSRARYHGSENNNRKRYFRKKQSRLETSNLVEQVKRPYLKDSAIEEEEGLNDMTTCIVITPATTEGTDLPSTTSEPETFEENSSVSGITEETLSTTENPNCEEYTEDTTIEDITTDEYTTSVSEDTTSISEINTLNPESTKISEPDEETDFPVETTTATTQGTSGKDSLSTFTPPITPITQKPPETEFDNDIIKIFNIKLVCKVGKPENNSDLQKVHQCYFGSSDGASFYMPSTLNEILTPNNGDHFPTIPPDKLDDGKTFHVMKEIMRGSNVSPANNTYRIIEATGVKTKIIEQTIDKNKNKFKKRAFGRKNRHKRKFKRRN